MRVSSALGIDRGGGRRDCICAEQPRLHQLPTGGRIQEQVSRGAWALLPCYWIYWEVRKTLERMGSSEPLFRRWIGTYASEQFSAVVRGVIEATNETAAELSSPEREAMRQCFVTTSRYEWLFWDMAYRASAGRCKLLGSVPGIMRQDNPGLPAATVDFEGSEVSRESWSRYHRR